MVSRFRTRKINTTLKYSIADGSAYAAMLGFTQDYMVPFALTLKATVMQVGLLSSLPNLAMALSQLTAPRLAARAGSRKGLILPVVFWHALMWLPILLVPFIFPGSKIWWLIGLFTLSTALGSLGNPAWGSMMADLVPEETRGRYFGYRGKVCGFVTLITFLVGGAILHFFAASIFLGFALLFGAAMALRLISWHYLSRMYEPPFLNTRKEQNSLLGSFKSLPSSRLGKFTVYVSLMNFATQLAGPFFAVYMLRDLQFSYMTYVIIIGTSTLTTLVFLTFWGRRADRAGNIRVLKVTSILIPFVPMLWVGSHQLYYLVPVQMLSGFAWAGFNLASSNYLYDASAPQERTKSIAVFNAVNGTATCLGAVTGGIIAPHLPALMGYKLLTLFLISGALRGLVVVTLLRHVTEVRRVPEMSAVDLLLHRLSPRRKAARKLLASHHRSPPKPAKTSYRGENKGARPRTGVIAGDKNYGTPASVERPGREKR